MDEHEAVEQCLREEALGAIALAVVVEPGDGFQRLLKNLLVLPEEVRCDRLDIERLAQHLAEILALAVVRVDVGDLLNDGATRYIVPDDHAAKDEPGAAEIRVR